MVYDKYHPLKEGSTRSSSAAKKALSTRLRELSGIADSDVGLVFCR
jgi:hypothetical protein